MSCLPPACCGGQRCLLASGCTNTLGRGPARNPALQNGTSDKVPKHLAISSRTPACQRQTPARASSLVGRSFSPANFNNVHCRTELGWLLPSSRSPCPASMAALSPRSTISPPLHRTGGPRRQFLGQRGLAQFLREPVHVSCTTCHTSAR